MALLCKAFVDCRDAQNRTHRLDYYVPAPASMGAGVNLATSAHQLAVINAMINGGAPLLSDAIVYDYGLEIIQTDLTGITANGGGSVPVRVKGKTRSGIGVAGKVDRFGNQIGILLDIPSLLVNEMTFSSMDRNAISMITPNWVGLRTALVAIGYTDEVGSVLGAPEVLEEGQLVGGKMNLLRPV